MTLNKHYSIIVGDVIIIIIIISTVAVAVITITLRVIAVVFPVRKYLS